MLHKSLLSAGLILSLYAFSQASLAADPCKEDKDCKAGEICILALNPPACKPPQEAGAPCKRDVVCASKKCDIAAGKDVGVCK